MAPTTVRPATESDIPSILSLLLTSFRRFPLFTELYHPIDKDISFAHDTLWFWRRRLLLGFLDPGCTILVAELPATESGRSRDELQGKEEERSWEMYDWLTKTVGLSQTVRGGKEEEKVVVGFAIWRTRGLPEKPIGWGTWARKMWIKSEVSLWKMLYQRKDQDRTLYESYSKSEDEMVEKFYKEPCYYLDNLVVDFRFQRRGIGGVLVQWGLENARRLELSACTEAGPMSEGLYTKMGFQKVGDWTVPLPGREDLMMPVLRHPDP